MINSTANKHSEDVNTTINAGKLKKFALPLIIAGSMTLVSVPVAAKKYRSYANEAFDYAKVVNVEPLYETYQVNNPVEQCYDERVRVRDNRRHSRHDSKTPEILGGIIGGAIGNRIGKKGGGKARDVATVVGAVLGGSIARDVKHNKRNNRYHDRYDRQDRYETVQRCETRDSYETRQELIGYDVTYKYRGNIFHNRFDEHPGKRIKVKVTVNPV
ncbi:glycine zipper 2TM domain-containing protein [Arenicella sp. 4NH20-0111]|uniref:glycine zipper 2TM domain-containing protein n=1 Tax=Arenicella sp. 4NH20-0111 TaxID=3127648 RepID=UPI0031052376